MSRRTPKPADLNRRAAAIVGEATQEQGREKNPNAVALGRLGGKARAERLTPAERHEAAKKARAARDID